MPVFPVKYVPLSSGADSYYKSSIINQFNSLEASRIANKLPVLRKTFSFGESFFAHMISADYGSMIMLFGSMFNIIFSGNRGTYTFSWADGSFNKVNSEGSDISKLIPLAGTGIVVIEDYIRDVQDISAKKEELIADENLYAYNEQQNLTYISSSNKISIYRDQSDFINTQSNISKDLYRSNGLIATTNYNKTKVERWLLSESGFYYSSYWSPNIIIGTGDNGVSNGMFSYPDIYLNGGEEGDSIHVKFLGYFSDYSYDGSEHSGYAELLVSIGETIYNNVYFYTDSSEVKSSRDTYSKRWGFSNGSNFWLYNVFCNNQLAVQTIKGGMYSPSVGTVIGIITKSCLWSFVENSSSCNVYKDGAILATGKTYNWHSMSPNGDKIAVCFNEFDASDSSESSLVIHVTDLGGDPINGKSTRPKSGWDHDTYKLFNETSDGGANYGAASSTGIIVPVFSKKDNQELNTITNLGVSNFNRKESKDPSGLGFFHVVPVRYADSISGWRIKMDGDDATGHQWEDDCWKNASYTKIDRPEKDEIVSVTIGDDTYSGSLESISNEIPYFLGFSSVEDGKPALYLGEWNKSGYISSVDATASNARVQKVTREDIYIHSKYYGCGSNSFIVSDNSRGPYNWSGGDGVELFTCTGEPLAGSSDDKLIDAKFTPICGDSHDISVTDSCGMTTTLKNPYTKIELSISGPEDAYVNDIYVADGGVPPYEFSFEKGDIDDNGKIISTSCGLPDSKAYGDVTVKDSCGDTASIEVRVRGYWKFIENVCNKPEEYCFCYDPCGTNAYNGCAARASMISGGTRTDYNICAAYTYADGCEDYPSVNTWEEDEGANNFSSYSEVLCVYEHYSERDDIDVKLTAYNITLYEWKCY